MDEKIFRQQLHEQAASSLTPKYLRMNSTKSEISEKEATDSGRIDSGFLSNSNLDSDFISTCSLLSDDNLNPTAELPHESDKNVLSQQHSHFDSGVDVEISEPLSALHLTSSSYIPTSVTSVPVESYKLITEHDEYWMSCYTQDEDGDTPLHIAILDHADALVHHLVQVAPSSVCLDVRNDDSQTALHLAVLTGQSQLARHLVVCNANYRKCDLKARTPLHCSVAEGKLECVRALTNPITSTELDGLRLQYEARKCLKNETINSTDFEGLTCVHLAAQGGNVDIMRQLVLNNGDINAREWKSGMTALHIAVEREDVAMVQYLLSVPRLNLEVETFAGFTPYQICYNKNIETFLLEAGAENLPHAEDENDMSGDMDSDEEEEDEEMIDYLRASPVRFNEALQSAAVH